MGAAHNLEVSAHGAPNLAAPVAVATPNTRHLEWFHDHAWIEAMLFDGALDQAGGTVRPDLTRPGRGRPRPPARGPARRAVPPRPAAPGQS